MDLASTPPPFDPPAAVVNRLRAAYMNCSETTLYNVLARFTGGRDAEDPNSIVAVALQNTCKEERLLGLTAEMPKLERLHVWPLGEKPALFSISPSGLFFASVKEPGTPKDAKARSRDPAGAYSLQGGLRRAHVSTRLQIELFASGQGGGVGSLLCLSAPSGCKMPWGDEYGGGAFCIGDENLFTFTVEPLSKGQGGGGAGTSENNKAGLLAAGKAGATDVDNYLFEPEWGEQHQGCRLGRLCCVDFKRRAAEMLVPPDETYAYGQPRWLPDGSGIVCTAWSTTPYCLGLQYCWNRRSKIFLAPLSRRWTSATAREAVCGPPTLGDTCDKLFSSFRDDTSAGETQWLELSTEDDFAAWSPVVLESFPYKKDRDCTLQVAFLALEKNSPTTRVHACAVLVKVVVLGRSPTDPTKWYVESRRVVKHLLQEEDPGETTGSSPQRSTTFTGIYSSRLVAWRHPDYLFANTFIGTHESVVCLHPDTGRYPEQVRIGETVFTRLFPSASLRPTSGHYSMKLLDMHNKWLLIEFSSLVHTPRLLVAQLLDTEEEQTEEFGFCTSRACFKFPGGFLLGGIFDNQSSLRWTPYYALVRHLRKLSVSTDPENRHLVVSWPFSPRPGMKNTLAVFLHGGPHSVACGRFSSEVAFLTMMGYDVLFVNYRGSLGFGQQELLSLLGKIGKQDVVDVADAVKAHLQRHQPGYDTSKTVLYGGSHGGFLTCHLLGQYPDLFAAAATRNPVTNLLTMLSGSDIPDWVYAEALNSDFDPTLLLAPEDVSRCHLASPIVHAKQIVTPLLLGIGAKDERVPPSQGIAFYKTLKALGRRARLLRYPEADHRIHQPDYAEDFWLNTGAWFIYYGGEPDKH